MSAIVSPLLLVLLDVYLTREHLHSNTIYSKMVSVIYDHMILTIDNIFSASKNYFNMAMPLL